MGIKAVIDFDNVSNFTYDNNLVKIDNGELALETIVPDGEIGYWNFDTDGDFEAKRGGVTLIKDGGNVNVQGGKLEFFNNSLDVVEIENSKIPSSRGAVHFKFQGKTTSFSGSMDLFDIYDPTAGSTARVVAYMQWQGGGVARLWIRIVDDGGTLITNSIVTTFSYNNTTERDILVSWDLVAGNTRVFFDGNQVYYTGTTAAFTKTPNHVFKIGKAQNSANPNYTLDDLQIFELPIKDSNDSFTIPVEEAFDYAADPQKIVVNPLVTMDAILDFEADVSSNTGAVKYLFRFDSIPYWWDGVQWSVSNGEYAQSTSAADLKANLDTLPISGGVSARLEIFIVAGDRYQTPVLRQIIIEYNFILDPTTPVLCDVYGTVKDNSGEPIAGAKVTFDTPDHFYGENFIAPKVTVFTGANGVFVAPVVETETTGITATVLIEYKESGKTKKVTYSDVTIPNTLLARLSDLV